MSTLTSSAISESLHAPALLIMLTLDATDKSGKTVAPRAAARRRAPPPPPPRPAAPTADEFAALTDGTPGAAEAPSPAIHDPPTPAIQPTQREQPGPSIESHNVPAPVSPLPTQESHVSDIQQALQTTQEDLIAARILTDGTQVSEAATPPAQPPSQAIPTSGRAGQEAGGGPASEAGRSQAVEGNALGKQIATDTTRVAGTDEDTGGALALVGADAETRSPSRTRQAPVPHVAGVKRKRGKAAEATPPPPQSQAESQIALLVQEEHAAVHRAANDVTVEAPAVPAAKPRGSKRKQPTAAEEVASTEGHQPVRATTREPKAKRMTKTAVPAAPAGPAGPAAIMNTIEGPQAEGPVADGADLGDAEALAAPKQKKKRQKKSTADETPAASETQVENATEEDADDPEQHEIDVVKTKMGDLTRDKGLGKTSERETKMSQIDWAEVVRKRRAGDTVPPSTDPTQGEHATPAEGGEATPAPTPQARNLPSGPQLRIVNGEIIIDEDTLRVDRQAQAAHDAANLQLTEDNDLTQRVNNMSWINDKKRDAAERVPFFKMKSDPWSEEETDRFYGALSMFGTDFFIISKMFPPKTRRQIKLKFIREERLDADRINSALAGESVPMRLEAFAEATNQTIDSFKDPRELEEELRVEGEEQRGEIERKRVETAESQKQRDIQMATREKDRAEREVQKEAQKQQRAEARARKRKGNFGTGTL